MNKTIFDNYWKINTQLQSGQILVAKNLLTDLYIGEKNIDKLIKIQIKNAEMRYQEAIKITPDLSEYGETLWIPVLFLFYQAYAQSKCENIEQAWYYYNLAIEKFEKMDFNDLEEKILFDLEMMKGLSFSSLLWLKGELNEAMQVLADLETNIENLNQYQLLYVNVEILFSQIVMQTGNYMLSNQKLVHAKKFAVDFDYAAFLAEIDKQFGIIDLIRGNLETSPQLLAHALEEFQKLDLEAGIAETAHAMALVELHKGNLDEANSFFDIAEPIFKEIHLSKQLSKIYTNRGVLANRYGDFTTAISYHTKSLQLKQEMNDEIGQSISFFNLGTLQSLQGHYDTALSHYRDALTIQTKLGLNRNIANTKMNIGVAYREKGESEIALKYFNEALSINEDIGNKNASARCLQNIASIHSFNSRPDMALQYYIKSLKIRIEVDNKIESVDVYYQLIQTCIVLGDLDRVEEYYNKLNYLVDEINTKLYYQKRKIALALLLKSKKRLKSKIKAQELLEEVINEGILIDTHVIAHLHLIDILLDELSLYGEEEVLNNIQSHIKLLQNQAKNEHQNPLLIESYIFEARMQLINLDLELAIKTLEQAYDLSNLLKLPYLVEKTKNEINDLRKNLLQWQNFANTESSLIERINRTNVQEYLQKVINRM